MNRLLVLLLALAIDLALGEPPNRLHPVAWMGRFISWIEGYAPRKRPLAQQVYGFGLVLAGLLTFLLPLSLILSWVKGLGQPFYLVTSAFLLKMTFSIRGLIRAALDVQRPLVAGDLDRARRLLSWHLVSRDTSRLEEAQVTSATIESIAENLTDSLIAPLFFYVFFGLPGAFAYRFLNTADAMLGYRDGYCDNLGKGAARLDDLANYIPARLAALFMVIGAWMARENVHGAWRIMRGHHGRTASPNAGWTMAAMAGALGVTLEKVGCYSLGEGGTCVAAIIGRALRVMVFTFALSVAFFGLLLVII